VDDPAHSWQDTFKLVTVGIDIDSMHMHHVKQGVASEFLHNRSEFERIEQTQ